MSPGGAAQTGRGPGLHSEQQGGQLPSPSQALLAYLHTFSTISTALTLLITQRINSPFALETAWSQLQDKVGKEVGR